MRIEYVELFYVAIPTVRPFGDGSQDALLVRIGAGDYEGWGECDASPLTTISSFICPMSHSGCRPVKDSILGQRLDTPNDIARIGALVRENSFDLLQADHMLSGLDIAMWDLLGRRFETPVHRLLGYKRDYPKGAYASVLFGSSPELTFKKVARLAKQGFRAVKLGWGTFGRLGLVEDRAQISAAREAAGSTCSLMIDAGTVWGNDVAAAQQRLTVLREAGVVWLEEPFSTHQYREYKKLSVSEPNVPLAAGEGSHNAEMAKNLIDHAGIAFIQIDTGRVGGISAAKRVVDHACRKHVTYVNHTFTSNLALSASLQPFAGIEAFNICEYPVELSDMARDLTVEKIELSKDGNVRVPEGPGLGITVSMATVEKYKQEIAITVGGRRLFDSGMPRIGIL